MARSNLEAFNQVVEKTDNSVVAFTQGPDDVRKALDAESKEAQAEEIVVGNMKWAAAICIVPVPVVDFLTVTAFQIKTLSELCELYGIPFTRDLIKNVSASLLNGYATVLFGGLLGRSALKYIPVFGPMIALASTPAMAIALTYATGKVFIQHFESGGTLLDFDPKATRDHYIQLYEEGLTKAAQIHS